MSKRILVVEDQEDNRQILRDLLSNAGYDMIEAEDGQQAIVAAAEHRPDLILMDIQLPMLDGYGEKPSETVMSSNGTSGAPRPAMLRIFAWRLPRMCVR